MRRLPCEPPGTAATVTARFVRPTRDLTRRGDGITDLPLFCVTDPHSSNSRATRYSPFHLVSIEDTILEWSCYNHIP